MKQFIITILTLFFAFQTTNCQVIEPSPNSSPKEFYDYHILKYKKNKNAALICSITGGALLIGGIVYTLSETPFGGEGPSTGPILAISGFGVAIASAPFFVSKRNHLKKAKLYLSSV